MHTLAVVLLLTHLAGAGGSAEKKVRCFKCESYGSKVNQECVRVKTTDTKSRYLTDCSYACLLVTYPYQSQWVERYCASKHMSRVCSCYNETDTCRGEKDVRQVCVCKEDRCNGYKTGGTGNNPYANGTTPCPGVREEREQSGGESRARLSPLLQCAALTAGVAFRYTHITFVNTF